MEKNPVINLVMNDIQMEAERLYGDNPKLLRRIVKGKYLYTKEQVKLNKMLGLHKINNHIYKKYNQ